MPLPDKMVRIIARVENAAHEAAESAAYNGAMDDGGASRMRRDVEFYLAGAEGTIPEAWRRYEAQIDPEYAEFERLRRKFEGR